MPTFADWVSLPENCSAERAVGRVADALRRERIRSALNPLVLHGPAGSGKSHLVHALIAHISPHAADRTIAVIAAREFVPPGDEPPPSVAEADLTIVEDLQHLPALAVERFTQLVDRCQARDHQLVTTSTVGPAQLTGLPNRLTTRLSSGLVVRLYPLSLDSRRIFLRERASRRGLNLSPDVLEWLANHLPGSGRQLDGAISRLATLTELSRAPLTVETIAEQFRAEADAGRPTVEHIAQRVGRYYRIDPEQLQSADRRRHALLPRQVSMYLARRLTPLSLQQIGAYFGGRDHSTVLHACRKVEDALTRDAALSGAVRQLQAEIG
jgi:chromosomal replication initiator protein